MRCRTCGGPIITESEDPGEQGVCSSCAIGIMGWLDNKVLTPENCRKMRETRGLTVHQLAKEAGCYPKTVKSFESGKRSCPAELVDPIYCWYMVTGGTE